jgi:hypothetical protein
MTDETPAEPSLELDLQACEDCFKSPMPSSLSNQTQRRQIHQRVGPGDARLFAKGDIEMEMDDG